MSAKKRTIGGGSIDYLATRTLDGRIVRVYQYDDPAIDLDEPGGTLSMPILVTNESGGTESLLAILDERKQLKQEAREWKEKYEIAQPFILEHWTQKILDIERMVYFRARKKWWQFWKR